MLLLATVVLSHLTDLYCEEVARVDQDMEEKGRVLSAQEQRLLVVRLLRQCLVLNEQAKHRVRGILMVYAGGVRTVLSPDLKTAWDTGALENLELPDPVWVRRIEREIELLENGESQP